MKKRAISGRMVVAAALIAALIVAIVCASVLLERGQQRDRERELQVQSEALKASMWTDENLVDIGDELYGFDHRLETFLFVGTDNSGSGNSDPEDFRGPMADFLLLMVLDHTKNTIGYLQIDRNTVTDVDELDASGEVIDTRELQICTAHWYGRNPEMCAENTVNAVKSYLGDLENIDGYFVINMDDIGRLNHTVGGVEVTIEEPEVACDVNMDGSFNVADVVLLQKWLLAVPDTHLPNWKAADLYEDDKLNVFDLCLMKRALLEQKA